MLLCSDASSGACLVIGVVGAAADEQGRVARDPVDVLNCAAVHGALLCPEPKAHVAKVDVPCWVSSMCKHDGRTAAKEKGAEVKALWWGDGTRVRRADREHGSRQTRGIRFLCFRVCPGYSHQPPVSLWMALVVAAASPA